MRARIEIGKVSEAGVYAYEVVDERGLLMASGWSRGSKSDARAEAMSDARRLGLEVR